MNIGGLFHANRMQMHALITMLFIERIICCLFLFTRFILFLIEILASLSLFYSQFSNSFVRFLRTHQHVLFIYFESLIQQIQLVDACLQRSAHIIVYDAYINSYDSATTLIVVWCVCVFLKEKEKKRHREREQAGKQASKRSLSDIGFSHT